MPSRLRARLSPLFPAASVVLALAVGACASSTEPPKVATVSTDPAPSVEPATPPSAATAAAGATPADGADPTAQPGAETKAAALLTEPDKLDLTMLEALQNRPQGVLDTLVGTGPMPDPALLAPSGGGGVAGLSLGGGSAGGLAGIGTGSAGAPGSITVKGPVVAVAIGDVQVKGGKVDNARPIVAGMAAGFRRCLNRALQSDPTSVKTGSRLVVKAVLDKAGAVTSSTATAVSGIPAAATTCMTQRVASAQFAPPDSMPSRIEIPVTVQVQ